jgi:hypothetical protein
MRVFGIEKTVSKCSFLKVKVLIHFPCTLVTTLLQPFRPSPRTYTLDIQLVSSDKIKKKTVYSTLNLPQ